MTRIPAQSQATFGLTVDDRVDCLAYGASLCHSGYVDIEDWRQPYADARLRGFKSQQELWILRQMANTLSSIWEYPR